jgi:hypothetical protein
MLGHGEHSGEYGVMPDPEGDGRLARFESFYGDHYLEMSGYVRRRVAGLTPATWSAGYSWSPGVDLIGSLPRQRIVFGSMGWPGAAWPTAVDQGFAAFASTFDSRNSRTKRLRLSNESSPNTQASPWPWRASGQMIARFSNLSCGMNSVTPKQHLSSDVRSTHSNSDIAGPRIDFEFFSQNLKLPLNPSHPNSRPRQKPGGSTQHESRITCPRRKPRSARFHSRSRLT